MDIVQLIDQYYKTHDLTKQATLFIQHPEHLDKLVETAVSNLPHPYPESASWILTHVLKLKPELLSPFYEVFVDKILVSQNQSVLRNLLHLVSAQQLTEYREGELLDQLIAMISDRKNKVALFVYALYKLAQFADKYPEIRIEIDSIIAQRFAEDPSPAMKIAVRNYHKTLGSHPIS